ncbi:hypothetical protein [Acinetobacter junii]|uniref:AbiTii domain-containing protein n=1 Tax=Acinetobacter junii TaxID=40215 RepID=UPI001E344D46|nr:hypothetical protein [Acinetobacter junii]MDH1004438.1 hypothetical protein [Acinetobacter junii]
MQLQGLASDPNSDIEELLNKALLVSRKLKIKEFRKWCELELEGYGDKTLPEYRKLRGQLKAFNPYSGLIPFMIPDDLNEVITTLRIKQSIGDIRVLLMQKGDSFQYLINNEAKNALMSLQEGFVKLEPRLMLYRPQLMSICTKVRSIVYNWSLKLEEDGILGEGLKFNEKEKEKAMSVTHFNIKNMQGVVGNVSGGTINQNNQMNIKEMDFDSLAKLLAENNVAFSDIQSLKDAIEIDPAPTEPNKLGEKVSCWIGSMIGKAANGSWDISVATAGTLLAESISKFYGIA